MCIQGWVDGLLWLGNFQMLGPMVRSDSHYQLNDRRLAGGRNQLRAEPSQSSSRLSKREG